jgi:hypothetical protein
MLQSGDAAGAPSGGTGWRHPGAGAADNGAVPLESAVMTS